MQKQQRTLTIGTFYTTSTTSTTCRHRLLYGQLAEEIDDSVVFGGINVEHVHVLFPLRWGLLAVKYKQ